MGRKELPSQRNVRQVTAIGVDALVEDYRGAAEAETLTRAGG